jgi:hypothetical protein
MAMTFELNEVEAASVVEALKIYVADLRAEIAGTEKHEWRDALHKEERALNSVMVKLGYTAPDTIPM